MPKKGLAPRESKPALLVSPPSARPACPSSISDAAAVTSISDAAAVTETSAAMLGLARSGFECTRSGVGAARIEAPSSTPHCVPPGVAPTRSPPSGAETRRRCLDEFGSGVTEGSLERSCAISWPRYMSSTSVPVTSPALPLDLREALESLALGTLAGFSFLAHPSGPVETRGLRRALPSPSPASDLRLVRPLAAGATAAATPSTPSRGIRPSAEAEAMAAAVAAAARGDLRLPVVSSAARSSSAAPTLCSAAAALAAFGADAVDARPRRPSARIAFSVPSMSPWKLYGTRLLGVPPFPRGVCITTVGGAPASAPTGTPRPTTPIDVAITAPGTPAILVTGGGGWNAPGIPWEDSGAPALEPGAPGAGVAGIESERTIAAPEVVVALPGAAGFALSPELFGTTAEAVTAGVDLGMGVCFLILGMNPSVIKW
mmetsp:Transcript_11802/g.31915  ORF Transcript_11802/g.31915 Transcript_11802/m.31915 type:complete len:431 (-) Transcript_11802:260-1552(-)